MFRPTASCQKRLERRLRGFRSQAIRILRKALASVDNEARNSAIVPCPGGKSSYLSHGRLSTPLGCPPDRNPGLFTRGPRRRSPLDTATIRDALRHRSVISCRLEVSTSPLPNHKSQLDTNAMHESYSVYRYNKAAVPLLPMLGLQVSKIVQAYFNMTPRELRLRASSSSHPGTFCLGLNRAFVSGRNTDKKHIKPDLFGKLSLRKNGFWRPFRRLLERQPRIQFKHYQSSVGVSLSIYDRRLELARQRLRNLESKLWKCIQAES